MDKNKKIRVMAIDDSLFFREALARAVSADPAIEVAAVAGNPFEAYDRLQETNPDVILCDVEMPRMNGIEFVRRLLQRRFVPVVMVSAVSSKVFEALEAGAVDFAAKPDMRLPRSVENFWQELIEKIKAASAGKAAPRRPAGNDMRVSGGPLNGAGKLIAIGASTGGTEAILSLLSGLPPEVPGIVIVQHIPPVFSQMFAQRLDSQVALRVKEAETGDYADPGTVLIAPGDRHMRIKKIGQRYRAECFQAEKVNGHCPSVDVLFESAAEQAGSSAVGILLTGMGSDGARGLLAMRRKGGRTIGQDEASCVVYGMPKVAFQIGGVEIQAPLSGIPQTLLGLLRKVT